MNINVARTCQKVVPPSRSWLSGLKGRREITRAFAAAFAAASLQVSSANLTYRTCKLENGVSILHDGNCEELLRTRQAQREQARVDEELRKEAEHKEALRLAEQQRLSELEKQRSESSQALRECLRLARCRSNQFRYHLARVTRNDIEALLGAPVLSHNVRQATYNYYRVSADGRRVVLQLELTDSSVSGIHVLW